MEYQRTKRFTRNEKLEESLKEVNHLLGSAETQVISSFDKTKYPVILIVGAARCGSTLFMQWLASLGYFAYPTNILSRFYGAPYIGAKIQQLLTEFDHNNEIFNSQSELAFLSDLGKTKGALAPNEFWYFWRRFFHYGEIQKLTEEELESIDHSTFLSELAAIENVFDKPFAMKGMIINLNIDYISKILDKVLFIHLNRTPFFHIQSLLKARVEFYGTQNVWYSFKIPEYMWLKDLNPYEQVTGQIYYTNREIETSLMKLDESKVLSLNYEEFCNNPQETFAKITFKLQQQGFQRPMPYQNETKFSCSNKITIADEEREKIIMAYHKITGDTIKL